MNWIVSSEVRQRYKMREILGGFKPDISPGNGLLIFCLKAEKSVKTRSNSPLPSHDGMLSSTLSLVPSVTITTLLHFHVGNLVTDLLFRAHTSLL